MTHADDQNNDLMRRLGAIEVIMARNEESVNELSDEVEKLKMAQAQAHDRDRGRNALARFWRERGGRLVDAIIVAMLALLTARGCEFHIPAAKGATSVSTKGGGSGKQAAGVGCEVTGNRLNIRDGMAVSHGYQMKKL